MNFQLDCLWFVGQILVLFPPLICNFDKNSVTPTMPVSDTYSLVPVHVSVPALG